MIRPNRGSDRLLHASRRLLSKDAVQVHSTRKDLIATHYKDGLEALKDESVRRLLHVKSSLMKERTDMSSVLRNSEGAVLRDKDTQEVLAVSAYVRRRRPLMGSNLSKSEPVEAIHRFFTVAIDDKHADELLKMTTSEADEKKMVETTIVSGGEIAKLKQSGFVECGAVRALVSSAERPRIAAVHEKEFDLKELKTEAEIKQFDAQLHRLTIGKRFSSWDLKDSRYFVVRNEKDEWLAGCEVQLRKVTFENLPWRVRLSMSMRGNRGLRALFDPLVPYSVCQVGAIALFSENFVFPELFQYLNGHFKTDFVIHYVHERDALTSRWDDTLYPIERTGFAGQYLTLAMKKAGTQMMVRTHGLNPFHYVGFKAQPFSIPLETIHKEPITEP